MIDKKSSLRILSYAIVAVMLFSTAFSFFMPESNEAYAASDTYRVLEIEPSNHYQKDFMYTYVDYRNHLVNSWEEFVRYVMGRHNANVQVTQMTAAEFNGIQKDLVSSYDLIYIGAKTDEKDTSFVERPTSSIPYAHMGKEYEVTEAVANEEADTRKSGTDITAVKKQALIEYADSGAPILISGSVYKTSGWDTSALRLDKESNMYDLIKNVFKGKKTGNSNAYKNVVSCSLNSGIYMSSYDIGEAMRELNSALVAKEKRCSLSLLEKPARDEYINKEDLNNRELKFKARISDYAADSVNAQYKVELYMDLNSDGVYSSSESLNRHMQIRDSAGKLVDPKELKKNTDYTITRDLGDYVGIIYWKMKITKIINGVETTVRDEIVDYCKVQPKLLVDGNVVIVKKNLKVLQIMANEGGGNASMAQNNVWLPSSEEALYLEGKYGSRANALGVNPTNEQVSKLADDIAKVEAKATNQFFTLYNQPQKRLKEQFLGVTVKFWLYTRNLDDFAINIDRIPVPDFEKAIENSEINVKDYDMLILGFADCYTDIKSEAALKTIDDFIRDGKTTLFTHDTTSFINDKEYTGNSYNWGYNINKYFRDILGMDRYGYMSGDIYESSSNEKTSKDYVWKGSREEAQGYSDYLLDGMAESGVYQKTTTTVRQVNSGQITTYPYKLPAEADIRVANTHGQYYQLDLESDDIVVWYCLSGGPNKYFEGMRNKDARNNYYIYNRKNITYSGAGHQGDLTNDEIKLFVNTMVGAYRASSSSVSIDITNSDASRDKNDNVYFYINYLKDKPTIPLAADLKQKDGTATKAVSFSLAENTVAVNNKMTISFGDIMEVYDKDGKLVSELQPDTEYFVYVPISELESKERLEIPVVLSVTYSDSANGEVVRTVTKKVSFIRRTIFNLN